MTDDDMREKTDEEMDELEKKILDEIRRENKEIIERQDKAGRREAYSLLFLVISSIVLFGMIFSGEHIPIWLALIILVGDVWSLHNLGIF